MSADPRCKEIAERYKRGFTLEEIGMQYGITRERARQLLVKYERATGEKIPRWSRSGVVIVVGRCPCCGTETTGSLSKLDRDERCKKCRLKSVISKRTIRAAVANKARDGEIVKRREAGEPWTRIGEDYWPASSWHNYGALASYAAVRYLAIFEPERLPEILSPRRLRSLAAKIERWKQAAEEMP